MVHNPLMGRWRAEVGAARSVMTDVDLRDAARLCAIDPVASVLAAARIESSLASGAVRAGSTIWGYERDGQLGALCWAGANLVPVCAPDDSAALDAFAETALRQGRRCSSIVGGAEQVLGLWERLEPSWGPARDVRPDQHSLVMDQPPAVAPDPAVRLAEPAELGVILPACVQMFVEEVGYSPLQGAPGAYEARVKTLIDERRSFVRIDYGASVPEVVFKAELGAVGAGVAQVQGVWVAPGLRGLGLSVQGMATVVALTLGAVAPVVSLYVNGYNTRALAAYARVGFRRVGTYATILF